MGYEMGMFYKAREISIWLGLCHWYGTSVRPFYQTCFFLPMTNVIYHRIGDLCNFLFAILIMRECRKVDNGLSLKSYAWMALNIASSFLVDLLPIIGDIIDAFFKFNTRNVKILERLLEERRAKANEEAQAAQPGAGEKQKLSDI